MKNLIRKAEARSREALLEAIGVAISAITDQDARSFFEKLRLPCNGSTVLITAVTPSSWPFSA
jgi:hypothetical protein